MIDGFDTIAVPHMLIEPFCASTVFQITKSTHAIKEFWVQCLSSVELPCSICGIVLTMRHICLIFFYLLLALFSSTLFTHIENLLIRSNWLKLNLFFLLLRRKYLWAYAFVFLPKSIKDI
ncbi:hypothetical protein GmHk_14G041978 [Glycine max]|nr:hypothetical protein GmHk_14G041978 [Glycine max]